MPGKREPKPAYVELRTAEGATIRISSLTKRDVRDVHALLTDIVNRPREEDDSSA